MFTGNNNYFTKILVELKKKNLKYWCSHGNPGDPLTTPLPIYTLMISDNGGLRAESSVH